MRSLKDQLSNKSDPLAYLLIAVYGLKPIKIAAFSIVASLIIQVLLAFANNALLMSNKSHNGILRDADFWTWCLLLQPIIAGYYLWSISAVRNVVEKLAKLNTIEFSYKYIRVINICYQKPYRLYISLIIAFCATSQWCISGPILTESWFKDIPLATVVAVSNFFIDTYIISMIVVNLFTNILLIQRILRGSYKDKKLKINPLHPDKCGGLSPLSQYSLSTAYLVAILGIVISLIEFSAMTFNQPKHYWYLHLTIPLYFILSLGCFFGPLITANKIMLTVKEDLLSDIAKQFHCDYYKAHQNLGDEPDKLKSKFIKINQLRSWYRITEEFPVWPFDLKTLQKYLLSAFTFLIPTLFHIYSPLVFFIYQYIPHSAGFSGK